MCSFFFSSPSKMGARRGWVRFLKFLACGGLVFLVIRKLQFQPCSADTDNFFRSYPKFTGDTRVPPDVTVVTAFFSLGNFIKGKDETFGPTLYLEWATVYKHLRNPLVVYTDSDQFVRLFTDMRQHLMNITKIIKIEKKQLWAFDHLDKVRNIYSDPKYPKYQPNTVVPEYPCVQNAKYLRYFRLITSRKRDFRLTLPRDFDEKKIAINKVARYSLEERPEDIFKNMYVWVGGGVLIAEKGVFRQFVIEYRKAVEHYLDLKLSNSDQQVLFAMYSKAEVHLKPTVQLQPYSSHWYGDCWFYLGYICYREV
ncbi:uncharacterized protein LOC124271040 [Haliotis rubra]|uniref:uncharacterized protein LOC124271040 n=1 Tax=Haliotis rubra TaxID=36100 RepID=UPI001EE57C4B|nr:uncharacterized protein LOC124271040 [Haliotis rubra]